MPDSTGIVLWEPPLRFFVQSESDAWTWYLVDLSCIGDEDAPKGFCGCPNFTEKQMHRIANGYPFALCKHLHKARRFVRSLVNRGYYDALICK